MLKRRLSEARLLFDTARTTVWLAARNRVARRALISGSDGPAVSLTTYGRRFGSVHITIESIARGVVRPSRLILWLDPGDYARLTRPLRRLQHRGLEVRETCADWGPHKKYFPYCLDHADDGRFLITADDDVIYPKTWLGGLMTAVRVAPKVAWAYRTRTIEVAEGKVVPYSEWADSVSSAPSVVKVAIGMCGVAFPPALQVALREAGIGFMRAASRTDDLWLHLHAIRAGVTIGQVRDRASFFPLQSGSQIATLHAENLVGGGNDATAAALYTPADVILIRSASAPVR